MSSAFYPQGMQSYNNAVGPGNYVSWKGTGTGAFPVGTAPTNVRPLTNNDVGNIFPCGYHYNRVDGKRHASARPLKQWRKGRVIPPSTGVPGPTPQVQYNLFRYNRSSGAASLGGGAGGTGQVSLVMDFPGGYAVHAAPSNTST